MGCCTIGLGELVESVLVVVVDAAPSSRVKAMIHAIMGCSLLLGTAVSPHAGSLGNKNFSRVVRSASPFGTTFGGRLHAKRKVGPCYSSGWLAESGQGVRYQLDERRRGKMDGSRY